MRKAQGVFKTGPWLITAFILSVLRMLAKQPWKRKVVLQMKILALYLNVQGEKTLLYFTSLQLLLLNTIIDFFPLRNVVMN